MTTSPFPTSIYTSAQFVESAGAILFRFSIPRQICLLYLVDRDEYVLAKGRRNCGESIRETAVREVTEETGYACRLVPVNMSTRAPPPTPLPPSSTGASGIEKAEEELEELEDVPRTFCGVIEPFSLQIRQLGERDVKIIWWYIAVVDENEPDHDDYKRLKKEQKFRVGFYGYEEALEKLTFQADRDVAKNAIEIFEATYS